MTYMFEVSYKAPANAQREGTISDRVSRYGGRLTFREEPEGVGPVCLTYEFEDATVAEQAASSLRSLGEHVIGPMDYGD